MAESRREASKAYQETDRGRAQHQARSLAYYYRRGKEQRRQRRAGATASGVDTAGHVDESLGDPDDDGERMRLTHSRDCESGPAWATVETTQAASAFAVGADRCVAENDDAQMSACRGPLAPSEEEPNVSAASNVGAPGSVLTTVAQVRAALAQAHAVGAVGVVVWGRCARCGRVGRVVHFDGVLRAHAQSSW